MNVPLSTDEHLTAERQIPTEAKQRQDKRHIYHKASIIATTPSRAGPTIPFPFLLALPEALDPESLGEEEELKDAPAPDPLDDPLALLPSRGNPAALQSLIKPREVVKSILSFQRTKMSKASGAYVLDPHPLSLG